MEAYKKLENVFEKAYRFQHFLDLANWDAAVMMPSCGAEARGEAMAVLKNHIHHMYSSPEVQALIAEAAAAEGEMSDIERANFREMQRIVQEETMFTDEFVKRKAKVLNMSQRVWAKAKAANNFEAFLPYFKQVVEICREEGRVRASHMKNTTPYGAMLMRNEPARCRRTARTSTPPSCRCRRPSRLRSKRHSASSSRRSGATTRRAVLTSRRTPSPA